MERVNFEDLRKQIFQELNKIRTDPKSYIKNLELYISYFRPQTNILAKPNEIPLQTEEGAEAFRNAIEFLKKQKAVPKLELNDNLNKCYHLLHSAVVFYAAVFRRSERVYLSRRRKLHFEVLRMERSRHFLLCNVYKFSHRLVLRLFSDRCHGLAVENL